MQKATYLERLALCGVNNAHPGGFSLTRKLLKTVSLDSETSLLDVGCGTGQTSAYIAKKYPCKVTAVDINPTMVARAQKNFLLQNLDIPLYQANAMDLPFCKNSFDIILSESVTAFTEIPRTLREYYRVLKPGGVLLAIEATASSPLTASESREINTILGIEYFPTKDAWSYMLKRTGFSKVEVLSVAKMKVITFNPFTIHIFKDFIAIMKRYGSKLLYGVYRCEI